MKTLPNQIDLATLATRLPNGSPGERVDTALAIWEAAGKRLDALAARAAHLATPRKADLENARIMQGIEFPAGTVSLEVFLAKTVPDKFPKPQRMEIFREFLAVPNPAMPGGVNELPRIKNDGIGGAFVEGFAVVFRRWLENYKAEERKSFNKGRSESAHLAQYGKKWGEDALAGEAAQTLEMLVSNTARMTKGDRTKAQDRVQLLIDGGLLVRIDGKLYGTPGSGKSRLSVVKTKPLKKK